VFFFAGTVDLSAVAQAAGRAQRAGHRGILYVIRNGKLGPEPEIIRRRLPEITGRAVSTMVKSAAFQGLHRMHAHTNASNLGFRYVAIPNDFESQADEPFDPREMKRLFELGHELGLAGTAWQDTPP
jgi:hypothetical protein